MYLKILAPKQTLQNLPIIFEQLEVYNTSKNLLNKIRKIINHFYLGTEIT